MIEETSKIAYAAGQGRFAEQKYMIYNYVLAHAPFTQHMIRDRFGLQPNVVAGRVRELEKAKLVYKIGKTREPLANGQLVLQYDLVASQAEITPTFANEDWDEDYPFEILDEERGL